MATAYILVRKPYRQPGKIRCKPAGNSMNFQELFDTITSSRPEQWNTVVCWGADSGPSYRDHFVFNDVYNKHPNVLVAESHGMIAAFKPNLSLTLAWGLEFSDKFEEPWTSKFANPKASGHYVDVFFNNALVHRDTYVIVDGSRAYLPFPKSQFDLSVPRAYSAFIELIDGLGLRESEYDRYFKVAGFSLSDAPWPS